ncbi:methyltransferase type 12 [hydrocarbon metagenome]|uniref:Methyltransferase type 12 n=1 Tax=hydrocarbon metagenome TaxID=938273 RepID=A0A0W8E5S3_9ZZZZ
MNNEIRRTFDSISADYDSLRRKVIPCFDDFYNISVSLLDIEKPNPRVLDIGAGTGLLSSYVLGKFPNAKLTLIDISEGMLQVAKLRFKDRPGLRFLTEDYSQFSLEEKYDIIVSALSIHHLTDSNKEQLYRKCYLSLDNGGIFVNADQVLGETAVLDALYKQEWKKFVAGNNLSSNEIKACYERMKLDKEAKLEIQLKWMRQAGFADVDCAYKYLNFAVMTGRKNAIS